MYRGADAPGMRDKKGTEMTQNVTSGALSRPGPIPG